MSDFTPRPAQPYQPGNLEALKHGAYSPRRVEPLAQELVEWLTGLAVAEGSTVAYLADPSYSASIWAWARAEARVQLLTEWLLDRGGVEADASGDVTAASRLLTRLDAHAGRLRVHLGLDPLSRARLGRDRAAAAVDFAALMAAAERAEKDGGQVLDVEPEDDASEESPAAESDSEAGP